MSTFLQIAIACTVFLATRALLSATMSLGMSERGLAAFYAPLPFNIAATVLNALRSFLAALVAVLCGRLVGDVAGATIVCLLVLAFLLGLVRAALGYEEGLIPWISAIAVVTSIGATYGGIVLGSRLMLA